MTPYIHPINRLELQEEWRAILDARSPQAKSKKARKPSAGIVTSEQVGDRVVLRERPLNPPLPKSRGKVKVPATSRDFMLVQDARDLTEADLWPEGRPENEKGDIQPDAASSKSHENHTETLTPDKRKLKRLEHNHNVPMPPPGRLKTATVDAVDGLRITGNVVPRQWLRHLRLPSDHADVIGAMVLAEIVFWFRSNQKGERKFSADTLQKSYNELAESLFLTARQVKDAVARLEAAGLARKEFHTIQSAGRTLSNVMFIHLLPGKLEEITSDVLASPSRVLAGGIPRFDEGGVTVKRHRGDGKTSDIYIEHTGEHSAEHINKKEEEARDRADSFSFSENDAATAEAADPAQVLVAVEDMFDGKAPDAKTTTKLSRLACEGRLTVPMVLALDAARRVALRAPELWLGKAYWPFHSPAQLADNLPDCLDGAAVILAASRDAAEAIGQTELAAQYSAHLAALPGIDTGPEEIVTKIAEMQEEEASQDAAYWKKREEKENEAKLTAKLADSGYPLEMH